MYIEFYFISHVQIHVLVLIMFYKNTYSWAQLNTVSNLIKYVQLNVFWGMNAVTDRGSFHSDTLS